jgi:hypothetical protein
MKPNFIRLHAAISTLKKRTFSFSETFVTIEQIESCYNTKTIKLEDDGVCSSYTLVPTYQDYIFS